MATVTVLLTDVVDHMDMAGDEATSYINPKTGELITLTHEELAFAEDPEYAADAPQWEKDVLPKAREVSESGDFIPLPSKFDIHEWSIMDRFVQSLTDNEISDELNAALHGSGAFRRFKDAVRRLGLQDEWYRFRYTALEEIAIEFLEEHGISYQRESRQKQDACLPKSLKLINRPVSISSPAPRFTAKQGQYLAFIYYYTKIHGTSPAEVDFQQYFRVSPPTVHDMILKLEARGLIERTPGQARSIRLRLSPTELPSLK